MKRKVFAGAVIAICLSLATLGTLAYFTDSETAHNVITSGGVDIQLNEWAGVDENEQPIPFPEEGITGVMPGDKVGKLVEITNIGGNDAYVRAKVEVAITLDGEGEADLDLISLDIDETNWELGADGFYYFTGVLAPNATTPPLFTEVAFDEGMGNEYQNCTVNVDVTAQAVQVANNGTGYADATGWPTTAIPA